MPFQAKIAFQKNQEETTKQKEVSCQPTQNVFIFH